MTDRAVTIQHMIKAWNDQPDNATIPDRMGAAMDVALAEQLNITALIDDLRAPEGASVTFVCDNPEFYGPNSKVTVNDAWTDWRDRTFDGDNVLACLRAAKAERDLVCVKSPAKGGAAT